MAWQDIQDDKEKYAAYLCSREWAEKREAVRERAYWKCERCFVNPMDACHHLTYERKYNELLEDLQAICTGCHRFTHGKSDIDPRKMEHPPKLSGPPTAGALLNCPRCEDAYVYFKGHRSTYIEGDLLVALDFRCSCGLAFCMAVSDETDATLFAIAGVSMRLERNQ